MFGSWEQWKESFCKKSQHRIKVKHSARVTWPLTGRSSVQFTCPHDSGECLNIHLAEHDRCFQFHDGARCKVFRDQDVVSWYFKTRATRLEHAEEDDVIINALELWPQQVDQLPTDAHGDWSCENHGFVWNVIPENWPHQVDEELDLDLE